MALEQLPPSVTPVSDNSGSLTVDGTVAVSTLGTVTPGTAATSLGKAEDAAHSSGDVGVMALTVRQDTAAALGQTDGDYQPPITDSTGRLHVNVGNTVTVGSHAVTNAGTFVVQENGAALTSLQLIDDAIVADDAAFTPATTKVMMTGFEFDDSSPDSVNEGDAGAGRMSANRNQYMTIRDAAGNERGVNVNASSQLAVSVDNTVTVGSHAVTNAGTFAVQADAVTPGTGAANLGKAEDAAHGSGDTGVMVLAVRRDADTTLADTTGDYAPLQVNAGGSLKVAVISGSAAGTEYDEDSVSAGAEKVTMAGVVRRDTAASSSNTDGDISTMGVDASGRLHVNVGASALPTGAATSAKQPALGTAGSASTDVITIQGIASGTVVPISVASIPSHAVTNAGTFVVQENGAALTSLQLIDDTVIADDAAFTPATTKVVMAGYEFDDAATDSVDEGDAGAARMSANRNQYVQLRDAAGNERGVNVNASNQLAVAGPVTNAGTFVVQENGAALTSLQLLDDVVIADDAAFTPATTKVLMVGAEFDDAATDSVDEGDAGALRMSANRNLYATLRDAAGNERGVNVNASNQLAVAGPVTNAGTFVVQENGSALTALQKIDDPVLVDDAAFTPATSSVMMAGFQADESSTDSVDEGDAGAARMTLTRKVIVTPQPHSAGGLSIFRSIDLDEGTLEVVKASPGCVYGMWVTNTSTGTRFIKFYDATSGTAGTGTPVITIGIPGNATDDVAGNFGPGGMGIGFATGISVGATTAAADADTGAPGTGDVIVNIFYL